MSCIASSSWKPRSRTAFTGWPCLFASPVCWLHVRPGATCLLQVQPGSQNGHRRGDNEEEPGRERGFPGCSQESEDNLPRAPQHVSRVSGSRWVSCSFLNHLLQRRWKKILAPSSPPLKLGIESVFMRHMTVWKRGGHTNKSGVCVIRGQVNGQIRQETPSKHSYFALRPMRKN